MIFREIFFGLNKYIVTELIIFWGLRKKIGIFLQNEIVIFLCKKIPQFTDFWLTNRVRRSTFFSFSVAFFLVV